MNEDQETVRQLIIAGSDTAKLLQFQVPENIHLQHIPPYTPE